jgi:hypothetical protein
MAYLGHYQYHDHHRRRLPSFLRIEADQLSPLIRSMTALKTQGAGGTIHAVTERDVSGHVASTRGSTVRHQEHSMRPSDRLAGPGSGSHVWMQHATCLFEAAEGSWH